MKQPVFSFILCLVTIFECSRRLPYRQSARKRIPDRSGYRQSCFIPQKHQNLTMLRIQRKKAGRIINSTCALQRIWQNAWNCCQGNMSWKINMAAWHITWRNQCATLMLISKHTVKRIFRVASLWLLYSRIIRWRKHSLLTPDYMMQLNQ